MTSDEDPRQGETDRGGSREAGLDQTARLTEPAKAAIRSYMWRVVAPVGALVGATLGTVGYTIVDAAREKVYLEYATEVIGHRSKVSAEMARLEVELEAAKERSAALEAAAQQHLEQARLLAAEIQQVMDSAAASPIVAGTLAETVGQHLLERPDFATRVSQQTPRVHRAGAVLLTDWSGNAQSGEVRFAPALKRKPLIFLSSAQLQHTALYANVEVIFADERGFRWVAKRTSTEPLLEGELEIRIEWLAVEPTQREIR